jgi:hypothetical protein
MLNAFWTKLNAFWTKYGWMINDNQICRPEKVVDVDQLDALSAC